MDPSGRLVDLGFAETRVPQGTHICQVYGAEEERDSSDGCTSFSLANGASGDGHTYAGQNWDWRAGTQGTVVVVRIVPGPEQLGLRSGGDEPRAQGFPAFVGVLAE